MSLSRKYGVNEAKQTNGVEYAEFPLNDDGTQPSIFLTRAASANPAYRVEFDRQATKARAGKRNGQLSPLDIAEVSLKTFAAACITGWNNVKNEDVFGAEDCPDAQGDCPHSKANAEALLRNLPDLYEELAAFATEIKHFQDEDNEADAGN